MKWLYTASMLLVWLGAVNWGLWGLFSYNVVESVLGTAPDVVKWVYILIGLAGVWEVYNYLTKKK